MFVAAAAAECCRPDEDIDEDIDRSRRLRVVTALCCLIDNQNTHEMVGSMRIAARTTTFRKLADDFFAASSIEVLCDVLRRYPADLDLQARL